MADWYVHHNGKVVGPFTAKQLKELAASAKIHGETQVRRGEDGSWALAKNVKGLFDPKQVVPPGPVASTPVAVATVPTRVVELPTIETADDEETGDTHVYIDRGRVDEPEDTYFQPPRKPSYLAHVATMVGFAIGLGLILLNVFGGLIAGIWLAIKGEWGFIIGGIVAGMIMPWVFTIASLPSIGLAMLLLVFGDPPPRWAMATIGLACSLWNALLIEAWVLLIFVSFMRHSAPGLTIALLIWAYSTTMSPLAYMAKYDRGATGTEISIAFAMLTYWAFVILFFAGTQPFTFTITAAVFALVGALICVALGVASVPPRQQVA